MIRSFRRPAMCPGLAAIVLATTAIGFSGVAAADDPPPPADGAKHHHNPAFAACKKQADDQKLTPGDARRDFMKNCMKSAQAAAPAAS
jgi:hypothetical protein